MTWSFYCVANGLGNCIKDMQSGLMWWVFILYRKPKPPGFMTHKDWDLLNIGLGWLIALVNPYFCHALNYGGRPILKQALFNKVIQIADCLPAPLTWQNGPAMKIYFLLKMRTIQPCHVDFSKPKKIRLSGNYTSHHPFKSIHLVSWRCHLIGYSSTVCPWKFLIRCRLAKPPKPPKATPSPEEAGLIPSLQMVGHHLVSGEVKTLKFMGFGRFFRLPNPTKFTKSRTTKTRW